MTFGPITPSTIPTATDWIERRQLEGEVEAAREACAKYEEALRLALASAAQAWRGLRGVVEQFATAQSRLVGRELRSVVDERLQPTRAFVSSATLELERDIWSSVG